MNLHFQEGFVTSAPTETLIEDYQMLKRAYATGDWSLVRCTMECLADTILEHTTSPDNNLNITPSPSSVINLSVSNGILMDGEEDLCCSNGKPVSEVLSCSGGYPVCDVVCPCFPDKCNPDKGEILLQFGVPYHMNSTEDTDILDALAKAEENANLLLFEPPTLK